MLARAVAAQTKSTFLKLAGPQLVQMFIGDGAKLVRDAFALAKEKAPAIIFIDELDAIGLEFWIIFWFNFTYLKEQNALIRKRPAIVKCNGQCWNCSINWTGFSRMMTSK
jgi:AAA+ superfamily predicted ATPase